jgi:Uri superfamily endonuclease
MVPSKPGTYALILNLEHSWHRDIGRLGNVTLPAGWYVYVGSAHGPGGLASRIGRHLRSSKTRHWHIDYLYPESYTVEIWYTLNPQTWECTWARTLSQLPGAGVPVPRFGASDCQCSAHLIRFSSQIHHISLSSIAGYPPILAVSPIHSQAV